MTILPITYLGSVEWFTHLAATENGNSENHADGGGYIIDIGENWVKQTARNRAEILTANGVAALTIPVHGGANFGENGVKLRTKDVKIDNSRRWQHQHWISLVSAYRASPFFDHYEERFAPLYVKKFNYLTDFNLELLNILAPLLGIELPLQISDNYIVAHADDMDLRGKKALRRFNNLTFDAPKTPTFRKYTQVFGDRTDFVPGLSAVDLLFCEGPAARDFLRR